MARIGRVSLLGWLVLQSAVAGAAVLDDVQVTDKILKFSTAEREALSQCTALFRLAVEAGGKQSTVTVARPGGGFQTADRVVYGSDLSGLTAQFTEEGACEAALTRRDAAGVNAIFGRDGTVRVFLSGETARTLVLIARETHATHEEAQIFPGANAVRRSYHLGAFTVSEVLQLGVPVPATPASPQGELDLEP
jgi:hypothetical protein